MKNVWRLWLLLGCLGGCPMASYLGQAARGQAALWWDARSIPEVVADPTTDQRTRGLLREVAAIKAFGLDHGLTPTQSYTQYVDVKRRAVCWVVSAAPALQLQARVWTFPVVGSFPYLGWFRETDARRHAEGLRADGWDVDVRPVGAYSTLGFLRDPVLSTMVADGRDSVADLANVILHESVHATLHVPGQGTFNESLAEFVADGLTPLFLSARGEDGAALVKAWEDARVAGRQRMQRLHDVNVALEALYAGNQPDAEKLKRKWALLAAVRQELGMRRPLNNATIMQYRTYETGTDGFEKVLSACGGNHARMLRMLKGRVGRAFSHAQETDLDRVLMALVESGC